MDLFFFLDIVVRKRFNFVDNGFSDDSSRSKLVGEESIVDELLSKEL
jgi:hypothetical protein